MRKALVVVLVAGMAVMVASCTTGPLARLMHGGGSGRVEIGVAPIGAKISVDGQGVGQVGAKGLVFYVNPGTHRLTAQYPGYEPWTGMIQLYSGEVLPYDIPPLTEWQREGKEQM